MVKIVNDDPKAILEEFQNAYYGQIGKRMTIGSEEYTLASVYSYVLANQASLANKAALNSTLANAEGEYLDAIADRYGLVRRTIYPCAPYFEGCFMLQNPGPTESLNHYVNAGKYYIEINGHKYTNTSFTVPIIGTRLPIRWECMDWHNEPLTSEELKEQLASAYIKRLDDADYAEQWINVENSYIYDGLICVPEYMDDDAFRQFIYDNRRLYDAGLAESFEAVVRNSCPVHFSDVHCLRQGDRGYLAGEANIIVSLKNANDSTDEADMISRLATLDINKAQEYVRDANVSLMGHLNSTNVKLATVLAVTISIGSVLYVSKNYSEADAQRLLISKRRCAMVWVNNHQKFGQMLQGQDILNVLLRPLTDFSDDYRDFGLTSQEAFNEIKDFVILGNSGSVQSVSPGSSYDYAKVYGFSSISIVRL